MRFTLFPVVEGSASFGGALFAGLKMMDAATTTVADPVALGVNLASMVASFIAFGLASGGIIELRTANLVSVIFSAAGLGADIGSFWPNASSDMQPSIFDLPQLVLASFKLIGGPALHGLLHAGDPGHGGFDCCRREDQAEERRPILGGAGPV